MSENTDKLALPLIQSSQAQKHVTHNEALLLLDLLTQLRVIADDLSTPPADPQPGDSYVVAVGATGDWAGHGGKIARHDDTGWVFVVPQAGWIAYVTGDARLIVHDGSGWATLTPRVLQQVSRLGLATDASPDTPFAARLNAALWTALPLAEGGDGGLVQTFNREGGTHDAGLVLQTGFTPRALIGQFGDDALRLGVSADGVTFRDGLVIDPATGDAARPNLPRFKAATNFDNFAAADAWVTLAINDAEFNDQAVLDPATGLFTAPAAGTYLFGATLLFKEHQSSAVAMGGRLLRNGAQVISGSFGQTPGPQTSEATHLQVQAMALLAHGDTVALQGRMGGADALFAAAGTAFWGARIG